LSFPALIKATVYDEGWWHLSENGEFLNEEAVIERPSDQAKK
jgi:hypothetical protein